MRNKGKNINNEKGFVLVLVLLVTTILIAVVVEFAYGVYVSTSMAANFRDSQRAGVLAENGVELARSALEELNRVQPHMTMEPGGLVFTRQESGMSVEIRVVDEHSRVSTRIVYTGTGVDNDRVLDIYTRLTTTILELDSRIIDSLADWIDADDEPRIYGAEYRDYYQSLAKPYEAKNAYVSSIDELFMVKGYVLDVVDALRPYISAYNDDGLININTAPREVLMSLSDDITGPLADNIITHRRAGSFTDRSDLPGVPGFETIGIAVLDKIVVESSVFRVYSKATVGDAVRTVEAVVRPGGGGTGVLYWTES
jgi:general secretion pathway protein K